MSKVYIVIATSPAGEKELAGVFESYLFGRYTVGENPRYRGWTVDVLPTSVAELSNVRS